MLVTVPFPSGDSDGRMRRWTPVPAAILVGALGACSSPARPAMYPAGSDKDDGYGDLAQKSARLLTSDSAAAPMPPLRHRHAGRDGDPYGGNPYGGDAYGAGDPADALPAGCRDAGPCAPGAVAPSASRISHYNAVPGLTGVIEGTVSWRGTLPEPGVTGCGAIEPSVRVAADRSVGGVLVYIEHVEVGRTMPSYGRPAGVGGLVAKRGCGFAPVVQIVTPLPAGIAIHGDATETMLRVTLPNGARLFELQEAGRAVVRAQPGVTRVEADDGSLGAAWVVAADTPYYAITDDRGRFRIDELAAGNYDVAFWRPPLADTAHGKLVYGAPVIMHRSIKVDARRPARLDLALER